MEATPPEVGACPKQLFLNLFLSHENEALEQLIESREKRKWERREKARVASKSTHPIAKLMGDPQLDWLELLHMPIGLGQSSELDEVAPVHLEIHAPDEANASSQEWSEDAIRQLHEATLHYSLAVLDSRGNAHEKHEILCWIFDPPEFHRFADGSWNVIPQAEMPFGFDLCCRICGTDPDRLRDGLEQVLRKSKLGHFLKEIQSGIHTSTERVPGSVGIRFAPGAGKHDPQGSDGIPPSCAAPEQALPV